MTPTETANARLAQEAWDHLSSTGVMSVNHCGDCVYSGSGCGFSIAIKPEFRELADSTAAGDGIGLAATNIIRSHPEWLYDWAKPCDASFAQDVQHSHDNSASGPSFLKNIAEQLCINCNRKNVPIPTGLSEYLESQS